MGMVSSFSRQSIYSFSLILLMTGKHCNMTDIRNSTMSAMYTLFTHNSNVKSSNNNNFTTNSNKYKRVTNQTVIWKEISKYSFFFYITL